MMKMIAQGMRIDSGASAREYTLPSSSGGSRYKRVQYVLKIVAAGSSTDDLTLKIEHSPDNSLFATHTDYPALADVGEMMSFDSDASVILGEYFRAIIKTAASAGQTFVVDVFEITRER